jgi:hypothetical protein
VPPSPKPASRPAPTETNPFAIAGPRRKTNPGNGGSDAPSFLSAKDLAAAFKLSFDPSANMDAVDVPDEMPAGALPDGIRPGAMMPRKQAEPFAAPVRRGGAFKKFVLFVLILAGTGFGVLMWVDPGARQKTIDWTKSTYTKLYRYATSADTKPAGAADANMSSPIDEIPEPPAPSPAAQPRENVAEESPTKAEAPSAAAEKPNDNDEPPPAPKRPVEKPAAEQTVNPEERMIELRTASYAASKKGDYKTALKLWEEMGQLPEQYRDRLYETRLKNLREAAGE